MIIGLIIELIGTIAFALSGAVIGIKKKMDVFGIIVLSLATAVGGGIIRDLMLGLTPPTSIVHPLNSIVAIISAIIFFVIVWYEKRKFKNIDFDHLLNLINVLDAIGLGAFTVNGIALAYKLGYRSTFILIIMGLLTGVGGGLIRDLLADSIPYILSKHFYATASLIGGIITIVLIKYIGLRLSISMIIGATIVVFIRLLAAKKRWSLPRID